jgi:hypothetical protein
MLSKAFRTENPDTVSKFMRPVEQYNVNNEARKNLMNNSSFLDMSR